MRKHVAYLLPRNGDLLRKGVVVQISSFAGIGLQKMEEVCYLLENLAPEEVIIGVSPTLAALALAQWY